MIDIPQVIDVESQLTKRAMQSFGTPPLALHDTSLEDEIFAHALAVLNSVESSPSQSIALELSNLESLVHDRDFGLKIVHSQSMEQLLVLARESSMHEIRQGAARVIGSSLWNNPEATNALRGSNLVTKLIDALKREQHNRVQASLIFALSAAVHVVDGLQEYLNANGFQVLRDLFTRDQSNVQIKCASFVEDNLPSNRNIPGVNQELTEWCYVFQECLMRRPCDVVSEKALSSLMSCFVCLC